jgi:predicted kinase
LEIIMTNPAHQSDVQINRIHSGAICEEIGERLSARLGPQSNELPARLLALMEQLAKVDPRDEPPKLDGI